MYLTCRKEVRALPNDRFFLSRSLTVVVNGRNEEGGSGHQPNRELANADLDQTTQLLFSTKHVHLLFPASFVFHQPLRIPSCTILFKYHRRAVLTRSPFLPQTRLKPNQIGQAVDLGTGYQERETTLEKSKPLFPGNPKIKNILKDLKDFTGTRSTATRRRATLPNFLLLSPTKAVIRSCSVPVAR